MDSMKLKQILKEKGKTQQEMAEELDISLQAFNGKINGRYQFNLGEALLMIKLLEITNPEEIFFANGVPYVGRKGGENR